MQQRAQMMNGVADDVSLDKSKPLMHTAIVNSRKVSRPGQQPGPMPQNPAPTQQQILALKQQQQQQGQAQQVTIFTRVD